MDLDTLQARADQGRLRPGMLRVMAHQLGLPPEVYVEIMRSDGPQAAVDALRAASPPP